MTIRGVARLSAVARRGRLPFALVVGVSLIAVTAAVSTAASAPPGVRLAPAGRWFASPADDLIFHVNGSARSVDAQARIDGIEPGSQVVQGDTTGYVVGSERILKFGKSTLAVEETMPAPAGERPVALEAKGGPYLVYRETGTVARLGAKPKIIPAGRPLGAPAVTPDGTLWLQRTDTNVLCRLRPDTDVLSCPASAPRGHTGALAVVAGQAVFVDTEADTISPVTGGGLGRATPAGVDLPPDAEIAPADVRGRLAVLDPGQHRMHLIDASTTGSDGPAAAPVSVELPPGRYSPPSAGRSSVVLLDRQHRAVLTFDPDGHQQGTTEVPPESGEPQLSRGEDDRVYVEGGDGGHVLVVDDHGRAGAVPAPGARPDPSSRAPRRPGTPSVPATSAPGTSAPTQPGRPTPPDAESPIGGSSPRTTPPVSPPSPRKVVPASPPGLPPGARAAVRGTSIVVSWGAAAANGAAVSGYRITWAADSGGTKSQTRSGGSRSTTLSGLSAGASYRITVAAENSAGRGPAATVRATIAKPKPVPTVTVSRGETTTYDHGCDPPDCAFIKVTMRGFKPNTAYQIDPHASDWGEFNPGASLSTDAQGNLTVSHHFPFNGVGQRVWVTVGALESNHLLWPAG